MKLPATTLKYRVNKNYYLLINTLSGAVDVVPVKVLKNPTNLEKRHLINRGYFLKRNEKLANKINLLANKQNKNIPYWFYILTTLNCNFGCPICYEKRLLTNSEVNLETLQKNIDFISRFQNKHRLENSRINLIVFGGEPLCISDKNIIEYILKTVIAKKWKATFVTNGSQIKKFIDLFKKYSNAEIDFRITLDGPKKIHNLRRPYKNSRESFDDVVGAIELLLKNKFLVKMQTILGRGNFLNFDELAIFIKNKGWLKDPYFQWRIEGSHDYANLDSKDDEVSEGEIVKKIINLYQNDVNFRNKIKFESFKYLGHIVSSFDWLGRYKTYSGPKIGFCEPQKGFHYVFSTTGEIYHCPRTINNKAFLIGDAVGGLNLSAKKIKNKSVFANKKCFEYPINTLCGGGCVVQKKYHKGFNCQKYASKIIADFINLMREEIVKKAIPDKIVSLNNLWE